MKYCRFCGRELVNGQCDCDEFQTSIGKEDRSHQQAADTKKSSVFTTKFQFDFSSKSEFFSSFRQMLGIESYDTNKDDPFEKDIPIVPDCIQAEENEIVVKQYNIAKLRSRMKMMKAEGRLMVTNRRILFRAAGTSVSGNILQEHQFNLDEIGGIEMHKDFKFSLFSLMTGLIFMYFIFALMSVILSIPTSTGVITVLGILLGVLGLLPTFLVQKHFNLKMISAAVSFASLFKVAAITPHNYLVQLCVIVSFVLMCIYIFVFCMVPNLVIKIKTKGSSGAMVIGSQKAILFRETGDDYSGFTEVLPWEDTVMAMDELGTMIEDLQRHGDFAIEKWSR